MTDDLALFGDDSPVEPTPVVAAPTPIADWQRDLIRKALDARGLAAVEERQRAVEAAVGRPVASLRGLTHDEAIRVLNSLGADAPSGDRSGASSWDSRDADTWIDRM